MISKLGILRRQLSSLRRARRTVRWATAWSALVAAVLWMLAGVFVLDVIFEMSVAQRIIVLAVAGAGAVGVFAWLVRPLLGAHESELDMALWVERQQRIDSDLVAAIQFEAQQRRSKESDDGSSRQLKDAVVDYVGQLGYGLNVFEGFSRAQMASRAVILALTLLVVGLACAARPDYASAFFSRLLLSSRHYPSATVIERVLVNHSLVLSDGVTPSSTKSAEGRPLEFSVLCRGALPEDDDLREVRLVSFGSAHQDRANLELKRLGSDERLARLREADAELQQALKQGGAVVSPPWIERVAALLNLDAPQAISFVQQTGTSDQADEAANVLALKRAQAEVQQAIKELPKRAESTAVFTAALAQMVDSVAYNIYLNDAWTDQARVAMIPLPAVELQLTPVPPKYARAGDETAPAGARQISVLQGSSVELIVRPLASNGQTKELRDVWITVQGDQPKRFALARRAGGGSDVGESDDGTTTWVLAGDDSPLANIQNEMRFEVQVTDADGLHLEPARDCSIRLRADRAPSGSASMVSRVVLPTAQPTVAWHGVTDDYGISHIRLHVDIYRRSQQQAFDPNVSAADLDPEVVKAAAQKKERKTYELLDRPVTADGLPLAGAYQLDLAPLELKKGDGLNAILEVVDYRGDLPGTPFLCDPLPLEISDENGVKIAVLEPDEEAEKQLTEIRNQILETGESP